MEIRHLRYFLAVAEELSFSKAAKRVHIEQSPLSRAIKSLEAELGVPLFERNCRRMELTAAGLIFQEQSRYVLAALSEARRKVTQARKSTPEQPNDPKKIAELRSIFKEVVDHYLITESKTLAGNYHQVYLTQEVHKAVQIQAGRLGMSVTEWINHALMVYFESDHLE